MRKPKHLFDVLVQANLPNPDIPRDQGNESGHTGHPYVSDHTGYRNTRVSF